ncbi:lipopolysaccharide biosynthesis protein [uncultured Caulobacter sp.]|uniref:lipopolysaccharide biosynthesis protein n=1 Tax=uncultured Caulobacter sp. TaxID=158749 RepID=UPI00260A1515|nr:lipopolysaccharide biosynthesis protein [uncultured Caulobacter sp.]
MSPTADGRGALRGIFGNALRLLSGKAGAGVISLVYIALAARALGPTDYGVLVLVHTYVLAVGGIIEFPGWHAVVRYGAQALLAGDEQRLARLLKFAAALELACGALAVAVAALLAPWIGARLGWSSQAMALGAPYSLAVLATVRATPAGYLQVTGRFGLLGVHSLVPPVARLIGAVVAWAGHWGLVGFLWAWMAAALLEWAVMWAMALASAPRALRQAVIRTDLSGVRAENPGLLRFMLGANADVTFAELAARATPLAIGWMAGPTAAGLFAIAQRATTVIAQPAQSLGQAAYAELARLAARGQTTLVISTIARASGVTMAIAIPVCALFGLFGQDFARLMGGGGFAAAGGLMPWLALSRTILLCAPPLSAALTALGRPGLSATMNFAGSLSLVALLPVALPIWGQDAIGPSVAAQAVLTMALLGGALAFQARPAIAAPRIA